jgi:serine/threonine protein kinase
VQTPIRSVILLCDFCLQGRSALSRAECEFQRLKLCRHQHVCDYVKLVQEKAGRLFIVSENHGIALGQSDSSYITPSRLIRIVYECLLGLSYLHGRGIYHGNVNTTTILLTASVVFAHIYACFVCFLSQGLLLLTKCVHGCMCACVHGCMGACVHVCRVTSSWLAMG